MFGSRLTELRDTVALVLNDPPYGEPYNFFTYVHALYGSLLFLGMFRHP